MSTETVFHWLIERFVAGRMLLYNEYAKGWNASIDHHREPNCHICGFPKDEPGSLACSYPHPVVEG